MQMQGGSPLRFDSQDCRRICQSYQIEANIDFNPRNGSFNERYEYFDQLLYQNRFVIERAFAWLDSFKALLIRYETKSLNWLCLNIIAIVVCFVRKINRKLKC